MKSMSLEEDAFQAQGCTSCAKKIPRAVMGPGCQFGEIYPWLDQFKYTLVGGASFTVGLGGYLSGGGHGLLSADHGLAIDQVLEVEMVTPQGEILVLNECQNQELYWAVRGVSSMRISRIQTRQVTNVPIGRRFDLRRHHALHRQGAPVPPSRLGHF
jgi:hypothetical protein